MIEHSWKRPLVRVSLLAGLVLAATVLLVRRPEAAAQDRVAQLPADLALVPGDATFFVHVRVGEVWNSELGKNVRKQLGKELAEMTPRIERGLGVAIADVERGTLVMLSPNDHEPVFVIGTTKPYDRAKVLAGLGPNPEENKHMGKTYYVAKEGRKCLHFAGDRVFAFGQVEAIVQLLSAPGGKGALKGALAEAARGHTATAGFQLPEEERARAKAHEPPAVMAWAVPLLDLDYGMVTLDLRDSIQLGSALHFADAAKAKRGLDSAQAGLAVLKPMLGSVLDQADREKQMADFVPILKIAETALNQVRFEQRGNAVVAQTSLPGGPQGVASLTTALAGSIVKMREAAERMTSVNNLRQIAIAMHNYHATHNHFPAHAIYSADGKPLLSWRVAILPYIDQDNLYRQFKLDEPWDSEHNKKLLKMMPPVYEMPGGKAKDPHATFYQAFVGTGSVFEGDKGMRLADITDGTSNTILVVEAGEAVPWTKPDDLKYDSAKPLPKLGGPIQGDFNAAFCDGHVRLIKKTIDPQVLHLLIQRSDGMVIDFSKIE